MTTEEQIQLILENQAKTQKLLERILDEIEKLKRNTMTREL